MLCFSFSASAIDDALQYDFEIIADFRDAPKLIGKTDCIPITVKVTQHKYLLRELRWKHHVYFDKFKADGSLTRNDDDWLWEIPKRGGEMHYCAQLTHQRGDRYDSRITKTWALFRADDLFPAASSVVRRGSYSNTHLQFLLPHNWSSVAPYREVEDHRFRVKNPDRLFDRPTGWVQLGELGVRRDRIARTRVAVTAPIGQEVTRLEILTLLTFTLPTVRDWFPNFSKRLMVASAVDEMWRGALSGPASLFLHGERPLVSENGTSTVLHELVHVAFQRQAIAGADWIDEGLAEYLALVLLHRAGGLTDRRFADALQDQKEWGDTVSKLGETNSSGAETAKAVTLFAQLHQEMGDTKFRELIVELAKPGDQISPSYLRNLAEEISEQAIKSLP
jgi:hypothetical protein